jgi:hypothetical protein
MNQAIEATVLIAVNKNLYNSTKYKKNQASSQLNTVTEPI